MSGSVICFGKWFGVECYFEVCFCGQVGYDILGVQQGINCLNGWVGWKDEFELVSGRFGVNLFYVNIYLVEGFYYVFE